MTTFTGEKLSIKVGGVKMRVPKRHIQPVLDHPSVQILFERKQTGVSYKIYPGMNHSRGEHSLGAMEITRQITQTLLEKSEITEQEALHLQLYALLHDMGHPPFSHPAEYVLVDLAANTGSGVTDHKERTIALYNAQILNDRGRSIRDCVTECGADPDKVEALLDHQDPLHRIVSAKVIGAEKLDYITRDADQAGFRLQDATGNGDMEIPPLGEIVPFFHYQNGIFGVEESASSTVEKLMHLYVQLYSKVYFHKRSLALERLLQKGIEWSVEEGDFTTEEVWNWTDSDLDARLFMSPQARVRYLQERIRRNTKYATGVIIIPRASTFRSEKKAQSIVKVTPEMYKNMTTIPVTPLQATAIERAVAEDLGMPEEDVTVTTAPRPEKMLPDEVRLYNGSKPNGAFFEEHPGVRSALQREIRGAQDIRVSGKEAGGNRRTITKRSERVSEIVTAYLQK